MCRYIYTSQNKTNIIYNFILYLWNLIFACMYVCVYIYTHICMCVCIYTYMYKPTHFYIYEYITKTTKPMKTQLHNDKINPSSTIYFLASWMILDNISKYHCLQLKIRMAINLSGLTNTGFYLVHTIYSSLISRRLCISQSVRIQDDGVSILAGASIVAKNEPGAGVRCEGRVGLGRGLVVVSHCHVLCSNSNSKVTHSPFCIDQGQLHTNGWKVQYFLGLKQEGSWQLGKGAREFLPKLS